MDNSAQPRKVEELRAALARRDEQIQALHQASLSLSSDLDLHSLLQRVAEISRELIGTRYAALGVLDAGGRRLGDFITSGIDPAVRRKIAHLPTGAGLLGHIMRQGRPIRVNDIRRHPDSVGFCANHPEMTSLLGVPVISKGKIIGDLYLSDKVDGSEFTEEDEHSLVLLAAHAAVAIENAQRYDTAVVEGNTLTAILNSMGEAVYAVDATGRVIRANEATCRLVGRSADDLIGRAAREVFRWEDEAGRLLDDDEYAYRVTLTTGQGGQVKDRFFRKPDGKRIPVSVSASPIADSHGRIVAAVQVVRDISHEREADELKNQIVSLVSHELRTPLGHIKGFASSLLEPDVEWDAVTQHDFIEEIDREADRLAALVADLLDMSKIESARSEFLERARFRPIDITQQALKSVEKITADHVLINEVRRDLPEVLVDGPQIERVIGNLVENAAKYSDPGLEIRITARVQGLELEWCVSDQGPGIPPEYRDRIFEKFFRIKTGRPRTPGTGLGLPICKGIVEAHGGRLWLATAEHRGSRFCFTVPLAREG